MYPVLRTLVISLLLGACMASVRGGTSAPPPPPPAEPPPAAGPPPRHVERRVIEGTVIDADTHQPIDRASVDVTSPAFRGEMTVQTGPDGRYRTEEIPPGEFGIRVRREGYQKFERKAVMGNGVARIDFELRRNR